MTVTVKQLGNIPIEMIKIKDRYRTDKGDIDVMAESLSSVGQIQSVIVDANMNLLAGERRVLGAMKLGWETIRAEQRTFDGAHGSALEVERDENIVRKNFTWVEEAKIEKAIFDLKSKTDPRWSVRKQAEIREIGKSQVHKKIQLAEAIEADPEYEKFETEDEAWKQYKRDEEEAAVQHLKSIVPEEIKQAPQWAKEHFIVGDALAGLETLEADGFDFAEVDPPYGIDFVNRKVRNKDQTSAESYNEIDVKEFPGFMRHVLKHTYRCLKNNSFCVVWFGMQWHREVNEWIEEAGFAVNPLNAIWYKGNSGQTMQPDVMLASCYEPFFLARKGQPKMLKQGRGNVFHYAALSSSRKIHLTEKPQELLRDMLDTICLPGSRILIPFLGSGATLRAAYSTGHTGMGFDLSEVHKERFLKRVAEEFEDDVGGSDMGTDASEESESD